MKFRPQEPGFRPPSPEQRKMQRRVAELRAFLAMGRGTESTAKPGSCLAETDTLAKKVFLNSNGTVRLDAHGNARHYHLRDSDGAIYIDSSLYQFFAVPKDALEQIDQEEFPVFVGTADDLLSKIEQLIQQYGFSKRLPVKQMPQSAQEFFNNLWVQMPVSKSGEGLTQYTAPSGKTRVSWPN